MNIEPRINDDERIETLFKVVSPLAPVKDGFGYDGVLLREKSTGKIQCHLCGKWFDFLATHVKQKHDCPAEEYRYKFSLPLGFPLCSKKYSEARSDISSRPEHLSRLGKNRPKNPGRFLRSKKCRKRGAWTSSCLAAQNKRGACKAQMYERYIVVADQVGREPSEGDLRKYDPPLMGIIVRRHGNLGEFLKSHGLEGRPYAPATTKRKIISQLRAFAVEKEKIPVARDFLRGNGRKYPAYSTIRRHFGSWRRAMSAAGFEHTRG